MADNDESDEHLEDLPTLRSQRRFLEVMSLVSAAYYWFDVQIKADGSLLGQSIRIGSTRYVLPALWLGLLWAAWRYGQHLYQVRPDVTKKIARDFRFELCRLATGVVRRYLSSMPIDERAVFGDKRGRPYFQGTSAVSRFDFERARRFDQTGKEVAPEIPRGPLGKNCYSVIGTQFEWLYNDAGAEIEFDYGIGRFHAAWLSARAATAAALKRSALFDYATPLVMFLFAALSLVLATVHPLSCFSIHGA